MLRASLGARLICQHALNNNAWAARMEPVEVTCARYRPDRITTLFVGESAPSSGAFFYHRDAGNQHA